MSRPPTARKPRMTIFFDEMYVPCPMAVTQRNGTTLSLTRKHIEGIYGMRRVTYSQLFRVTTGAMSLEPWQRSLPSSLSNRILEPFSLCYTLLRLFLQQGMIMRTSQHNSLPTPSVNLMGALYSTISLLESLLLESYRKINP